MAAKNPMSGRNRTTKDPRINNNNNRNNTSVDEPTNNNVNSSHDSSGASSDFFSPISASFFGGANRHTSLLEDQATPETPHTPLPVNHDSSWIGARLSPITSFLATTLDPTHTSTTSTQPHHHLHHHTNDPHDLEQPHPDDNAVAPQTPTRYRALHESMEAAPFVLLQENSSYNNYPNERSTLLLHSRPTHLHATTTTTTATNHHNHTIPIKRGGSGGGGMTNQVTSSTTIHPLWVPHQPAEPPTRLEQQFSTFRQWLRRVITWGTLVCTTSLVYLLTMLSYDLYRWWNHTSTTSTDNNHSQQQSSHYQYDSILDSWTFPWIVPSSSTLFTFGAFSPNTLFVPDSSYYNYGYPYYYWRILTSLWMATSVVEWLFLAVAWRMIYLVSAPPKFVWYQWVGVYMASTVVGQLWTAAFDATPNCVCGAASWGTMGVLCCIGVRCPSRRAAFFLLASLLLLLSLVQRPYSSVMGATGSSFFGWALACAEESIRMEKTTTQRQRRKGEAEWWRYASRIAAISFFVVPTLFLAFKH